MTIEYALFLKENFEAGVYPDTETIKEHVEAEAGFADLSAEMQAEVLRVRERQARKTAKWFDMAPAQQPVPAE